MFHVPVNTFSFYFYPSANDIRYLRADSSVLYVPQVNILDKSLGLVPSVKQG